MMDPQRFADWRRTHPPILGADLSTDARRDRPPRDNLVRAAPPAAAAWTVPVGVALRAEADGAAARTLFGHFTVFDRWTEIDSMWEGNFLERILPGATKKTLREQTPKVLFQHGMDPQMGDRVITAAPDVLREDDTGPYFEARLLDGLDQLVYEGLRAGVYGISFRFSVMREEWNEEPGASEHNPKGLPERSIKEIRVSEFGPVTFPAYPDADVGIRSMTDELMIGRATSNPDQLRAYLDYLEQRDQRPAPVGAQDVADTDLPAAEREAAAKDPQDPAPPKDRAEESPHPAGGRRDHQPTGRLYGLPPKEKSWRL